MMCKTPTAELAVAAVAGFLTITSLPVNADDSALADLLRAGNRWAPVCTDCHGSHAVTPKTAYNTCVACHEAAMVAHRKWLPNAGLHLEVVSCAACHAPGSQRTVDLRLYDGA